MNIIFLWLFWGISSAAVDDLNIHEANKRPEVDISRDYCIIVVEDAMTPIRCISRGGSPPPEMKIFLGRTDCTKHFRFDSLPSMTGEVGFRYIHMTTMLVTDYFRVSSNDDGKKLNCFAQVTGLQQVVKSILIIVHCEYCITLYCNIYMF